MGRKNDHGLHQTHEIVIGALIKAFPDSVILRTLNGAWGRSLGPRRVGNLVMEIRNLVGEFDCILNDGSGVGAYRATSKLISFWTKVLLRRAEGSK